MLSWHVLKMESLKIKQCINLEIVMKLNKVTIQFFFYMLIRVFWGRMHVTCMCVWVSQGILWMSKRCQRRWTMKVQISVPNLTNIFFINGNHFCSHSDPESSIILNGLFDFRFLIFDQILACMGVPNTVVQFTKAQSCYLITTPWIHVQMHTLICTYIYTCKNSFCK